MLQEKLKARMTYQTCFPVSLRTQLDNAASALDMSLNAFVARLLGESVRVNPILEPVQSLKDEPMCKPFSLRLPPQTMLVIQDGALLAKRKINTEIILRIVQAMQKNSGSVKSVADNSAWDRLSKAIDAIGHGDSGDGDDLAELKEAKNEFERILTPLHSTSSRSGLFGDSYGS